MTEVARSGFGPDVSAGPRASGAVPAEGVRHPQDPEPVRSTKAAAVLALGLAALVTGPFVGGIVPARRLVCAGAQARGDVIASRGYLTGARSLKAGRPCWP
jgi:hypothetical protein